MPRGSHSASRASASRRDAPTARRWAWMSETSMSALYACPVAAASELRSKTGEFCDSGLGDSGRTLTSRRYAPCPSPPTREQLPRPPGSSRMSCGEVKQGDRRENECDCDEGHADEGENLASRPQSRR